MSNSELLPIYIDSYRLTQDIFRCTVKFPKEYKFLLGSALNEAALTLCCLICEANHHQRRSSLLDDFLSTMEKIKLQLRLCADFKILSCQQQALLATEIEKIVKQAVAWMKSERRKKSVPSVPESETTPSYSE